MPRFSQSKTSAWIQAIVSRRREVSGLYAEIAANLPLDGAERVLDVGTGTGLQLRVIHQTNPSIALFGLDLSVAAICAAKKALGGMEANLRAGSIESTEFPDDYFDIVTCNSSMSYWENPLVCFNEMYRILKPGGTVKLFEPHREIDLEEALDKIRDNMADNGHLRRWGAVQLNKFALKRGRWVGLTLYSRNELLELAKSSHFGEHSAVDRTSLLDIPIFVCIHLWKPQT